MSIKLFFLRIYKDIKNYWVGIALFLVLYFSLKYFYNAYCPLILITGLPCPACGMTRAVLRFCQGEWIRAYNLQPTVFLWVGYAIYWGVYRYILGKKSEILDWIFIILLLFQIGVYIYRMMTIFPEYAPMTYRSKNLFRYIIPNYREMIEGFTDAIHIN